MTNQQNDANRDSVDFVDAVLGRELSETEITLHRIGFTPYEIENISAVCPHEMFNEFEIVLWLSDNMIELDFPGYHNARKKCRALFEKYGVEEK